MKTAQCAAVLTALLVMIACGGDDEAPVGPGTSTSSSSSSSGGGDGGAPPTDAPKPPDAGAPPVEGVFVSSSKGDDLADGTREHPVKTLATAIPIAKARGQAVVACAETYAEAVKLVPGVTMYGYFDCNAGWVRVTTRSVIQSPTTPGVLAEGVDLPVRFEGFEVNGPDVTSAPVAGTPAKSSYGMIINSSKNIYLSEVTVRAGAGQDGIDGMEAASNNAETNGVSTKGASSKMQEQCVPNIANDNCLAPKKQTGATGGTSICAVAPNGGPGGQGGDGNFFSGGAARQPVLTGSNGRPAGASASTAAGAPASVVANNTRGSDGLAGEPGELGQNGVWIFSDQGADAFAPGNGAPGKNGKPGQGGGGGAGTELWWTSDIATSSPPGTDNYGLAGAGGGAGGCGGVAGGGGTGGGASVGLLVISSEKITITESQINAKKGGRGGKGALGFVGLAGSAGGAGKYAGIGIDSRPNGIYGTGGGNGAAGGPAGLSGHGAPGPSIALAFHGTKPEITQVQLLPGAAGDAPATTTRGAQTQTITGITKAEHTF